MMYVEFMKNFHPACWNKLMAVKLIWASWAQKRLIASFYTCSASSSWKIFFLPIRTSQWLLDSFRRPERKSVWFLLSRHDVRRVHEKFSSRQFERDDGCYTHFCLLCPKTFDPYFLDMVYVEFMKNFLLADSSELMAVRLISAFSAQKRLIPKFYTSSASSSSKFSSRRFERAIGCYTHFCLLCPKMFDPHFLDMIYVEFMKIFLLADSSELMAVRLISAFSAQKRLILRFYTSSASRWWKILFSPIRARWWLLYSFLPPVPKNVWSLLSRHDIRRVHEKFSSRRFERADGS